MTNNDLTSDIKIQIERLNKEFINVNDIIDCKLNHFTPNITESLRLEK
jgi:hypothetical protein